MRGKALFLGVLSCSGLVSSSGSCRSQKGQACVFPFRKGTTTHHVCAPYKNKFWCATSLKEDGITYKTWDYCHITECPNQGLITSPTSCPSVKGQSCVFPFRKGSSTHHVCAPYNNKFWCATSVKEDGSYKTWDYCDATKCPNQGTCSVQTGGGCIFPYRQGSEATHYTCGQHGNTFYWCQNSGSTEEENTWTSCAAQPPAAEVARCPGPESGCQVAATKGQDYNGTVKTTASGLACKEWSSTSYSSIGSHSYCRNPSSYSGGLWCYTADPSKRWEVCDVPTCQQASEKGEITTTNLTLTTTLPASALDHCPDICDSVTLRNEAICCFHKSCQQKAGCSWFKDHTNTTATSIPIATATTTTTPHSTCPAPHENPSLVDFFDSAVTMQNVTINTTCCAHDHSSLNISCGQSMSCSARCTSLGATLCPTQQCTEDPKDCHPTWPPAPAEEESSTRSIGRAVFKPSQAYNWCPRYCKWVRYYPACCLHPKCYKKQPRRCNWLYYYLGSSCPSPGMVPNGEWSCSVQQVAIPQTVLQEVQETGITTYPALQCRLSCSPGYVSHISPIVTCVRGKYEPLRPSQFVCEPAAALIISSLGEVEIFSKDEKCQQKLTNTPPFDATGHTLDLVDNQLIMVGYVIDAASWKVMTLDDPRGGLLANQWSNTSSYGIENSRYHTSYVRDNALALIGGDQKTQAKLENGEWKSFNLRWVNGSIFSNFSSASCGLKLRNNMFMVIGGIADRETSSSRILNVVVTINGTDESVTELTPIKHARAFHSCVCLGDFQTVLISGGYSSTDNTNQSLVPDEVYNTVTGESQEVTASLGRYQHHLILLEDTVFALGGRGADGALLTSVERFDVISRTWIHHANSLLSNATAGVAVAALPISAVDCVGDCLCGILGARGSTRIVNSTEAKENSRPWVLILSKDSDDHIISSCSATLIGSNWAVTAAHCVFDDILESVQSTEKLSVFLGVYDRRKLLERNR